MAHENSTLNYCVLKLNLITKMFSAAEMKLFDLNSLQAEIIIFLLETR